MKKKSAKSTIRLPKSRLIYAICNQKGGVGKTTTAVNIAALIATRGYDTLLIDLDSQCNATSSLGIAYQRLPNKGAYDLTIGQNAYQKLLMDTYIDQLKIIPGSPDIASIDIELSRKVGKESMLLSALRTIPYEQFQFIILDCPPSLGMTTVNALVAADKLIIPVQCEYLAMQGLESMMKTFRTIRRNYNPNLDMGGVLLSMYDRRNRLSNDIVAHVRAKLQGNVFQTLIPRTVKIAEAPRYGKAVHDHAFGSKAHKAYEDLATEILHSYHNNLPRFLA